MKIINWVKGNWTDAVFSKVFAGVILAILMGIVAKVYQWLNLLLSLKTIQNLFSKFNDWISEESQISNLTLSLILLFIGIVISFSIYNLITKRWIGRTNKFYASDSSYTVRGTYSVDLDLGIQAKGWTDSDFWWQQKTKTERSIVPMSGAKFCVIGQTSKFRLTKEELEKLVFSDQEILADDNHSNKIPTGTQIAYKTKQGRLGILKIKKYDYNLEIEFYTLKLENE
jgi:hypothetical protein